MADWFIFSQRMRERQAKTPPPVILRLREFKSKEKSTINQ